MNMFHDSKSARQKGTLANIRVCYNHKNVIQNTKKCFNATHEFIEFVTTSYVLAAAITILGTTGVKKIPHNIPHTKAEKLMFLNSIAQKV